MKMSGDPGEKTQPRLYLMPGCGICHQVKAYLEYRGVEPSLCWITEAQHETAMQELIRAHGGVRSVPILELNGELVQGFKRAEIDALLRRGGHEIGGDLEDQTAGLGDDIRLPANAFWVANFLAGSLSFFDPVTGRRTADDLDLGAGSNPMGIAFDPQSQVAIVSDYGKNCLYFFDVAKGGFLGGNAQGASLPTPDGPADIVLDSKRGRFYVPATQAGRMLALDARTGKWANGTLENSSLEIGHALSGGIAIDPGLDRIFFGGEDVLRAIDLDSFTLIDRPIEVGVHRGLAVDPVRHRVHVAGAEQHVVTQVDGRSFTYLRGERDASSTPTDRTPFAIAVDGDAGYVFVSCMSTQRIMVLDAEQPGPAGAPPLEAAETTRTFAWVAPGLLAASSFDEGEIALIDTRAARFAGGARQQRSIKVSEGARGIAWIGRLPFPIDA